MKKVLFILVALAVAGFALPAMAKDGLSVELGFAYNFNGADMGKTIVKDGEEGAGLSRSTAGGTSGNVVVFSGAVIGKAIMPENQLLLANNDATKKDVIASVSEGGVMQGLNTALRVRYNFLNAFFARIGFVYDMQISGGETSYKFGPTANQMIASSMLSTTNALNVVNLATALSGLANGTVKQTWTYGYWSIPVTIGINVPINDGKYNIYAGLGLTYYSGYWQLEMSVPAGYSVSNLAIVTNGGAISGGSVSAAGKEKVKFEISGIGFNYVIGASAEVVQDVSIFIEWDATVAAGMSDSVKLKSDAGKWAFGSDNVYYPVNLSTSLIRFGASYRLPVL